MSSDLFDPWFRTIYFTTCEVMFTSAWQPCLQWQSFNFIIKTPMLSAQQHGDHLQWLVSAAVICLTRHLSSRLLWQVAWLVVRQMGPTYLEQGIFLAFHELMTLGVPHQSAHVVWVWNYGYCCYSDDISMKLFGIGVKDNCTLPFCIIFCGCKRW